jgi:alpha-ketoglutarate-dependent taurine dioxygenase
MSDSYEQEVVKLAKVVTPRVDPRTQASDIFDDWGSVFEGPHNWLDDVKPGALIKMLYERKILVFKKIKLDPFMFWRLSRRFGIPWKADQYGYSKEKCIPLVMPDGRTEYMSSISNKISARLGDREMPWHADIPNAVSYAFPHRAIYMRSCPNPQAGFTVWLNTPKAFKGVSDDLKCRWGMTRVVQQSWYEPGKDLQEFPSMTKHIITGEYCPRVNYYVDETQNEGWIVDTKIGGKSQGTGIVAEMLEEMSKQPDCVYEHHWDETDLIIYDNFPFVHRRTACELDDGQERLMWRMNIDHDPAARKLFEAVKIPVVSSK